MIGNVDILQRAGKIIFKSVLIILTKECFRQYTKMYTRRHSLLCALTLLRFKRVLEVSVHSIRIESHNYLINILSFLNLYLRILPILSFSLILFYELS